MALNYEQFAQQATPKPSMFNFEPKQSAVEDNYMTREEVRQALANVPDKIEGLKKLANSGFTLEGYNDSQNVPTTQPAPQETGMMSSIGQFGKNLSAGIASGASQAVGGTLGIVGDFLSAPFSKDVSIGGIFTGENKGGLGQLARDETARQQQAGAQAFGADTESLGYKGGKFTTGLGLSIATPGGVMGLAGKGAGLATRAGLGAAQGAIETGKFLGLTEGRLGTPGELALGATVGGAIPVIGAGIGKAKDLLIKTPEQKMLSKLGAETVDAVIDNVAVKIPKPKPGIIKTVVSTVSRADDPKVLAGRALTPSYAGKTPKQVMSTVADTEKNVNSFWKLVRTGKLKGDLSDLTTSAQSVVDNIDDVGAKIGGMVKSAKGQVGALSDDTNNIIADALGSITAQRSPATQILKNLVDDLGKGIDIKDGFALKRVYQNEIGKLIRSGDAGTDQFSALVKGVDELSNQIDTLVEKSAGSKQFLELKQQYALLKKLASDITKSAQVEARRSPMTLTEQMGTLRGAFDAIRDPLGTANAVLAKTIGEMNTRGGAWQKLIETYDGQAIKQAGKIVKPPSNNPAVKAFVGSRSTANPFKDLKFLNKVSKGEVKGLSKEALNAMKGVKTAKEAMEKAKSAGVEKELVKAYSANNSIKSSIIDKGVDKIEKGFEDVKSFVESIKNKDFKGKSIAQQFINTSKYVGLAPYQKEDGSWGVTLVPGWKALAKAGKLELFGGKKALNAPKTGWLKGADGKMKFEIDDSSAKILKQDYWKEKEKLKLTDLSTYNKLDRYDNMNLYKMTEAQKINKQKLLDSIGIGDPKLEGKLGNYLQHDELFRQYPELKNMPVKFVDDPRFTGGFDETSIILSGKGKDNISSLLHEIQHAIQSKEGFARGGDNSIEGMDVYRRLAGEVEARNVQSRISMSNKERNLKNPKNTEDTPRKTQIIKFR